MPLLSIEDATVTFGGLHALEGVNLEVEAGRVGGLIGPNGAGKTTLFNVITGLQDTSRGRVTLDGRDISKLHTHERARLGLARTFQRLEVFGSLTAKENLLTAAEIRKSWARDRSDTPAVAEEILDRVGLRDVADEQVDKLPTGMARLVELGRALATRPKVLLLDEPSSGLDERESVVFGDLLLALAAEGLAILLVEHDVQLVMTVCRHIHVLDFGMIIASGSPDSVQRDPHVQAAYLGTVEVTGA
ncbi:MAG TPA: ABC transporter ATP-binding protein [Acidimicrobiia bacterium]|nr:ABC transporter ATP-binding protein [Acidimicrobiia bacterium]